MSAIESANYQLFTQRHWLTVAQLAAATAISRRTVAWRCQHGDLQHCHKFDANPNGGPAILLIDLSHAPEEYRLAYAKKDAHERGEAILNLTDRQRRDAELVAQYLDEAEAFIAARRTAGDRRRERDLLASFIEHRRRERPQLNTPAVSSYYRLRERWRAGGKTLVALADQRALPGKGVKREFDEDAFALFSSLYLSENRPTATDCYRTLSGAAKEHGWQIPSLPTVMRTLDRRVPRAVQVERREGKTARMNKCDSHITRDWTPLKGNEFWVSDHCQFDVLAYDDLPGHTLEKDGGFKPARLWLTTWMDERSRVIVGSRIHRGPNAHEVMASFIDAVEVEGKPANIRIDNGKDYRCQRFAGGRAWREEIERLDVDELAVRPILRELGITPHFTTPYIARAKIIEPWHHHWVHERFDKKMPGYCGTVPSERPEGLADVIKRGGLMRWSELIPLFAEFLQVYHLSHHSELGKCPAIIRQETLPVKQTVDARTLRLLLQDFKKLMIRQNGIELMGCSYGLGNPEIAGRQGEYVLVRWDRQKIGQVYVYEPGGRYICSAENNGRLAANARHEDVAAAIALRKRHNKMAEQMALDMPILSAIDPAAQIALQQLYARNQIEEAGGMPEAPPITFQPMEFAQNNGGGGPLPFRPVRPAADGSKNVLPQVETQATDSPVAAGEAVRLPENLMDLYAAG